MLLMGEPPAWTRAPHAHRRRSDVTDPCSRPGRLPLTARWQALTGLEAIRAELRAGVYLDWFEASAERVRGDGCGLAGALVVAGSRNTGRRAADARVDAVELSEKRSPSHHTGDWAHPAS